MVPTDFVYLEVRIVESITTGLQTVEFSVPASLIPTIQYQITRDINSETNSVTLEKIPSYPVHLFYEVGLMDTINEYDWSTVRDEYPFKTQTESIRECRFYTNEWELTDIDKKIAKTEIFFDPSEKNGYYYYNHDTPIYVKDETGYIPYTGDILDTSNTYYYEKISYHPTEGNNHQYFEQSDYYEIDSEALKYVLSKGNSWYIPQGVFKENSANETILKTESGETSYVGSDYILQAIAIPDNIEGMIVSGTLGNNGECGFQQGKIRIEKQVKNNDYAGEHDDNTEFEFKLTTKENTKDIQIAEEINGQFASKVMTNGTISFKLKNHEFKTYWFPLETEITVEEMGGVADEYKTSVTITRNNQVVFEKEGRKGIISIGEQRADVIFINYGELEAILNLVKVDKRGPGLEGAVFQMYQCEKTEPLPPNVPYPPDDKNDPNYNQELIDYQKAVEEYKKKLDQYYLDYQNYEEHIKNAHSQVLDTDNFSGTCWKPVIEATSISNGRVYFRVPETGNLYGFKKGYYRLVELKAPEGYMKPIGQWNVKIIPNGDIQFNFTDVLGPNGEKPPAINMTGMSYKIPNYKPIDPPITGGRGIWQYFLLGAVITFGGVGLIVYQIRRKKHGNS